MKNITKFSLVFISLIAHQLSFAGSYLFCANENGDSKWANPNQNNNDSWAPPDENGFWLKGSLYIVNAPKQLHSALSIDLSESKSRNKRASANDFNQRPHTINDNDHSRSVQVCRKLITTCQSSFGNEYKFVGAASHSLAATDWGYIAADNIVCPNWDYKEGLSLLAEEGSSIGAFLGDLVIDTVASGPFPEKGVGIVSKPNTAKGIKVPSVKPSGTKENPKPSFNRKNVVDADGFTLVQSKPDIPYRAYEHSDNINFSSTNIKKYKNHSKALPEGGNYYEIDIPFEGQNGRDAKRVVVDRNTGKRWYTKDHYDSFIEMNSIPNYKLTKN
ncbi:ribonuclease domain-containing protein [Silvanigrella aquatica]|uniref:Uncharacterized protein n=1 Tax=Silvanigrella aquatica TaxID=1915309 RepID=A0A1L4D411_9BACT|nr:ribonuclease domain-containing protein [Silvanigrella aquatica]APJ04938.1 hypothetical protein AXG55_13950 [Silvanigrella aquatica]